MNKVGYLDSEIFGLESPLPLYTKNVTKSSPTLEVHLFQEDELIGHITAQYVTWDKYQYKHEFTCQVEIDDLFERYANLSPYVFSIMVAELHYDNLQGFGLGGVMYAAIINEMLVVTKGRPFLLLNDTCGRGHTNEEALRVYEKLSRHFEHIKLPYEVLYVEEERELLDETTGIILVIDEPISLPSPNHIFRHRSERVEGI